MKLVYLFSILLFFSNFAMSATENFPTKIAGIEARLFYHHSGKLSEKLTGEEQLWNSMIGEGWAGEPSTATLIVVIVSGKEGSYPETSVELTVVNAKSKKIISEKSQSVGVLSETGKYHVPFWLSDTGCEPLQIIALIKGSQEKQEMTIPFACGE